MEDTTGEHRPDPGEEYGGPVKPFLEHLEDFRWVLIKCMVAVILGMVVCMIFTNELLDILAFPLKNMEVTLESLDLMGPMWIMFKCSLWGGLLVSFPFLSYFIGQFVVPALKQNERKYVFIGVGVGVGLFTLGVLFGYFFMLNISVKAFILLSEWVGLPQRILRPESYYPFVIKLLLGIGFSFELPVIVLTLVKIGILNHSMLKKARPYAIIINLIISAIVTPTDPFTTVLMAAPLQLLYEVAVLVAAIWERQEKKRLAEDEARSGE